MERLNSNNPADPPFMEPPVELIEELVIELKRHHPAGFLDVGYVGGNYAAFFNSSGIKVTILDLLSEIKRRRDLAPTVEGKTLTYLPAIFGEQDFPRDHFHCIACFDILSFLPFKTAKDTLKFLKHSLIFGGLLLATFPLSAKTTLPGFNFVKYSNLEIETLFYDFSSARLTILSDGTRKILARRR
jgi:2-polyprenyl-3-methyl-5-hydroxy-6-metoxy-1,4-benzoquinol methylase